MPACSEPRIQHGPERQHQLAVELGHDRQSSSMGSEDVASHLQASHEAGRNMGGSQEIGLQNDYETVGGRWVLPLLTEIWRVKSELP